MVFCMADLTKQSVITSASPGVNESREAVTSRPEFRYAVRQGGLMRCCLQSLDDDMVKVVKGTSPTPVEGDKTKCRYCNGDMRFNKAAWEWDHD